MIFPLNLNILLSFENFWLVFGPAIIAFSLSILFCFLLVLFFIFYGHTLTLANFKRFLPYFVYISFFLTIFIFLFNLYLTLLHVFPYCHISVSTDSRDWIRLFVCLLLVLLFYFVFYYYIPFLSKNPFWSKNRVTFFSVRNFTVGLFAYSLLTFLTRLLLRLSWAFSFTRQSFVDVFFSSFFVLNFVHIFSDQELLKLINSYAQKYDLSFTTDQVNFFLEVGRTSVSKMHSVLTQAKVEMMRITSSVPVSDSWFTWFTGVFNTTSHFQKMLFGITLIIFILVSLSMAAAVFSKKNPEDLVKDRNTEDSEGEDSGGSDSEDVDSDLPKAIIDYVEERKQNWLPAYCALDTQELILLKQMNPILSKALAQVAYKQPVLSPLEKLNKKKDELIASFESLDLQQYKAFKDKDPVMFQDFAKLVAQYKRERGFSPSPAKSIWSEWGHSLEGWFSYIMSFFG